MSKLASALLLAAVVVAGCKHRDDKPPAPVPAPVGTPPPVVGAGSGEGDAAAFVKMPLDALVGHRAPAGTLDLLDGTTVDLATLIGHKPLYLKFWATWCVPCREQMPHLEATFRAHGDQLAVFAVDVGINDPIENVKKLVAEQQLAVPVAIDADGRLAEALHLNVTPQHVIIDRAGIVRYVGHAVTPELERAIAAVLAPDPVATGSAAAPAPAPAPPPAAWPALPLDDGSAFDFDARGARPIALTFATLFCDSYIANSRPEIGATCAAHARAVEAQHAAHPELAWVTVAFPVWTSDDDIAAYRQRLGATVPIGIDRTHTWFRRFDVRDTYTTILLDARGAELGRVGGDGAQLAALIAKAPQP